MAEDGDARRVDPGFARQAVQDAAQPPSPDADRSPFVVPRFLAARFPQPVVANSGLPCIEGEATTRSVPVQFNV
ncbi:MAG: hypothetical protein ACK559_12550, partial [bacterium]